MSRDITPFDSMDRMFDQMRHSMFDPVRFEMPRIGDLRENFGGGHVRLEETDDGYVVLADIPGFEREELSVRFDEVLHVTGEHHVEDDDGLRSRRVDERVRVPGAVDVEAVSASYRHGLLEVSLPVVGEDDGAVIDIE